MIYRKAKHSEAVKIAELLSESFQDYPLFEMIFDKKVSPALLFDLNLINVKAHLQKETCHIGIHEDNIVSVALLKERRDKEISLIDYIRFGGIRLTFKIGIKRASHLIKTMKVMKNRINTEFKEFWYLDTFAVSSKVQGQRIGSKMIQDYLLPYIKKHGGGKVALNTQTTLNDKFYRRNGFTMFYEDRLTIDTFSVPNYNFIKMIN